MNKKVVMGLVATAILGTTMVSGKNVEATGSTNDHTDAAISFYEGSKPGAGPFTGKLTLAYVPASFNFGNNEVVSTLKVASYSQKLPKDNLKQYLAVSDDRADKKNGWTVKATLDEFENKVTDAAGVEKVTTLDNAELTFNLGTAQKYGIDTKLSDAAKPATPTPEITAVGSLTAMSADELKYYEASPTSVKLVAGADTEVPVLDYGTQTQSGASTLAVAKEISGVQLKVMDHANAVDKKFTSKVNWTLAEDPKV